MRTGIITILAAILSFYPLALCGQHSVHAGQDKARIVVFVCKNTGVTTPLEALRAELTRSLVNSAGGSYIVLDRTDDILDVLKKTYKYQGTGFVRDDQLVEIGAQLGESLLYVVNVTHYEEYGEFFFEGKFVDVETTGTPKSAIYPDAEKGQAPVTSLSPQSQIKAGRELAAELKLLSDEEIGERRRLVEQQEKEREEKNRQQRIASRRERTRNAFVGMFNDKNSIGGSFGMGANGFLMKAVFNAKIFHLGGGFMIGGLFDDRGFSLANNEGVIDGRLFRGDDNKLHEAKYYIQAVGLHFSAGINFKYVGFAVCPELFFLQSPNERWDSDVYHYTGPSDYVYDNYPHTLIGVTPTVYFNIPFKRWSELGGGDMAVTGSVGYTLFPSIKSSSGFQFSLGWLVYL